MRHLGRLLFAGYGLAAVASLAAHQAGVGVATSALIFWLGGAAAVAGLAVAATALLPAKPSTSADEDAALAEALRLWERDRLGDRPAAEGAARVEAEAVGG